MSDNLPEGWVATTLGEIVEPARDRILPTDAPDRPYVGLQHVESQTMRLLGHGEALDTRSSCLEFSTGDILYARMRPYLNKVWVAEFDGMCSPEFLVFKQREGINTQFLALRLNAEDFVAFANLQVSGERPRADFERLAQFPLRLPPSAEQDRIVRNLQPPLSALERAEKVARRTKQRLQRYRAAVLNAAITGELTKEWRNAQVAVDEEVDADLLLQRILRERRSNWEAVEVGKLSRQKQQDENWKQGYRQPKGPLATNLPTLPQGWIWASVAQVGEVQIGRQRSPKDHSGEFMRPYLRVANVFEDRIDTSDILEMNFTPDEFETFQLKYGDILLNEGQSLELVGRPAMYRDEVPGSCFQNTLIRFRSSSYINRDYALIVFRAYLHNGRFQQIAKITTNLAHLGADRFTTLEFPLPPVGEQDRIVEEVTNRFAAAEKLEESIDQQIGRSSSVRQALLRRAFSGELVAQESSDEPAHVLLARIQEVRESEVKTRRRPMPRSSTTKKKGLVPLLTVLQESGKPMTAEQLFREAGYEQEFKKAKSSQEIVDQFYSELRQLTEAPPKIAQTTVSGTHVLELLP